MSTQKPFSSTPEGTKNWSRGKTPVAVDPSKRARRIFEQIDTMDVSKEGGGKVDAFLLANGVEPHLDASFFYVTGFSYGLFEGAYLLARRDGAISLITSPLEEPIARSHANGIDVYPETDPNDYRSRLQSLAGGANVIALNSPELTYKSFMEIQSALKNSKLVDASEAFETSRLIKDEGEIQLIKKACDISSRAFKKIPSFLKVGVTESMVAAKLAYEMQTGGGTGLAFDSIIAFGKNSAEPHYSAGAAKLRKGQFVLCDYGTKYMRYCSDITRTMVFGKASKQQRRMYEVVKQASELGKDLCTSENTGEYVNSKVTELINSTEFKGRFIHSTGHSLGLSVHDGPGLSERYKKKLQPGMVLTVEPGIYVPEIGGVRIEDDVVVTSGGKPKVLTSANRELIEI